MINYILLFLGSFAIYYGILIFRLGHKRNRLSDYILAMGIACGLWCFGYALMGLTPNLVLAPHFRRLALAGVASFMSFEGLLFIYKAGGGVTIRRIMGVIFAIFSLGCVFIWGADDVRTFYRAGDRTYYVNGTSNGYYYQPIYMAVMTVILLVIYIKWRKNTMFARDKRFQKYLAFTNVFIVLGSFPDTILPLFGINSFPSSPLSAFATYVVMLWICKAYMAFDISDVNMGRHAYTDDHVGFIVFNLEGRLTLANDYALELLGLEEVNNQRFSDLFDLQGQYDKNIYDVIMSQREYEWQFDARKTGKSCRVGMAVVADNNDDPYCIIGAVYDRTAEQEMQERIIEAGEAKSRFLANMSHEIRTPINAILGMNEMIMKECGADTIRGYAQNMNDAGHQLLNIINDILDFSKIQSGMMAIINTDYDLDVLLHKVIIEYRRNAKHKGLTFVYEVDETLPTRVHGDDVRLAQILENLLDNAVKYTSEGSVSFKVKVMSQADDEMVVGFIISDTGKGISEENQTNAGSGLGLAIVRDLTQMMSGEIHSESISGQGTTFTLSIPLRVVAYHQIGDYEGALAEYEADKLNKWNGEFSAPTARILVVDDNKINLNVAEFHLKKTEATVDTAVSGQQAIALAKRNSYQIIFLDHIMPRMDGVETLRRLKEEHLVDDVPVICLSANDFAGAKQMYMDYGFTDYLSKPVKDRCLEKKVYEYLPDEYIHESTEIITGQEDEHCNISVNAIENKEDIISSVEIKMNNDTETAELTHIFVFNPVLADAINIEEIRSYLSSLHNFRYFIFTVIEEGGETELVRKIQHYFEDERLRIYALGGSGTMRNIINGIEDFDRVEVAFCPQGLTNDFLKVFGHGEEYFRDLRRLIAGEVVAIDYIKTTGGIALNTFSLGLDANLGQMLKISRIFSIFGQKVPYIIAFIYSMFISSPDEYEIVIDDTKYEGAYTQIVFGNGNTLGGSFIFDEYTDFRDGLAKILLSGEYQGVAMLPTVMAMVKGDIAKLSEKAILKDASRISIRRRDGGPLTMNFDGEMVIGTEKWEAEIVKRGLRFVLPEGVRIRE